MIKNKDYFKKYLEQQMNKNSRLKPGNNLYGGNVLPTLKLYENLSIFEEKMAFQEAIADLLVDSEANKRRFAITICTGFIDFRKSL